MSHQESSSQLPMNEISPWMSEQNFWEENVETIGEIFDAVHQEFPDRNPPEVDLASSQPEPETMAWMWRNFMGHQHGSEQGFGGKIPLTADKEASFRDAVGRLRYGAYSFLEPHTPESGAQYDKAIILGGSVDQNAIRLMAALNNRPLEADVQDIVLMAGQRLRWNIPGERDVNDIYATSSKYGVDIEKLRARSPWVQAQEQASETGDEWERPYATEFHLGRLCVESAFMDAIDWKNEAETHLDPNPPSFTYYEDGVEKQTAPRDVTHVTYHLKDGRRAHVINGQPVPRPSGDFPKPTSNSTTVETIGLIGINEGDSLVISSNAPHMRAGVDVLIRTLALRGSNVSRADIAVGETMPNYELLAALGEIPATIKADIRLRAVLAGDNPDDPALMNL